MLVKAGLYVNNTLMHTKRPYSWRTLIVWLLLLAAFIALVLTQGEVLRQSFAVIRRANLSLVIVALAVSMATTIAGSWTYQLLSLRPLPFRATWIIQLAGLFVGRVIPAGIGGIGLNYRYLRVQHLSGIQAGSTIAMNNVMGVTGNTLLLLAAIPFWVSETNDATVTSPRRLIGMVLLAAAVLCVLTALILFWARYNRQLQQRVQTFLETIRAYRRRLPQTLLALGTSLLLTSCNALALVLTAHALGSALSFAAAVGVFSFGIVLTVATPTPGGIGGAEASIAGALIVAGLAAPQAIATALLFRLVNFWLPLIPGALALVMARRSRLI